MKNFVVMAAAAVAGLSQLCSGAPACGSGTLSSYIGLGSSGCTVGGDTLFNFQALTGTTGATEISSLNVQLSPLGGSSIGLTTSVSVMSAAGNLLETLFTYQISGSSFTATSLTLSNASETGDGAVTGLTDFCAGGSFGKDGVSGCTGTSSALATVDGAQNTDSAMFKAAGLVSVTNDLTIDGGLAGSAAAGTLVNQFTAASTAVPEPVSLLLTGIGLALAASRRSKFSISGFIKERRARA